MYKVTVYKLEEKDVQRCRRKKTYVIACSWKNPTYVVTLTKLLPIFILVL